MYITSTVAGDVINSGVGYREVPEIMPPPPPPAIQRELFSRDISTTNAGDRPAPVTYPTAAMNLILFIACIH